VVVVMAPKRFCSFTSFLVVAMGKPKHQNVECKTIDGITLRGWLFTVAGPAPAIIMSHGVSHVQFLPTISLCRPKQKKN